MARSRRHKKVHTGSQTAEFSRKLVFCSRAILAACKRFKAENACFRWTRSAISYFWRVYRSAKRDYVQEGERPVVSTSSRGPKVGYSCLGGDLNPILGFCFPPFSRVFPRKFPSAWKTVECSGSKTAANCCKSTYIFGVGYISSILVG